jgi:hypothetical protein
MTNPTSIILGGIAYAFMDLASKYSDTSGEKPALLEFASQLVNTNLKYLDRADVKHDKEIKVGFLLGAPGIHVSSTRPITHNDKLSNIQNYTHFYFTYLGWLK